MRIGIVGSGNVGSTLAELFIRAGHEVTLSHAGAPDELRDLVTRLGERARATTVTEAVRQGDVVVLALPFGRYRELPPEPFRGKIVVDATNYYPSRDGVFAEIDDGRATSSELIDRHLGEARLVKALNNLPMAVLEEKARPRGAPDRIALPLSSEYPEAKSVVARLIDQIGFDPVDLGGLVDGGRLYQQGGLLYLKPQTAAEQLRTLGVRAFEQPHAH